MLGVPSCELRAHANRDIAIHNNATERGLRGIALHYGSRSLRGTRVVAVFYSSRPRLIGVNPVYLREATQRAIDVPGTVTLPRDILEA